LSIVDGIDQTSIIDNPRDFPVIYQAVLNGTYDQQPNHLHHTQMAMKYIAPMRDALSEWDNNQQSQQYYEDLAWGALTLTSTFQILHPQGSLSRQRIIATNQAEDTNQNVNTPNVTYHPLSLPCN
jgi:hypothetical protein